MMINKTKALGIIITALLFGTVAQAQQNFSFQKGERTFTLSGSGASDKKFNTSATSVQFGFGWLIADNVSLAVRQGVSYADVSGNSDWNGSSRVGVDFYLDLNCFQPFLGAGIGYVYGDTVRNQFIAGPNAGVLYFINQTTFVSLGIEYQFLFKNTDEFKDSYNDGRFVYALGMGVRW
jgi:outer membrane protein W